MALILLLHAASTLMMTGLIWFVQIVHYPLFPFAAIGDFRRFAVDHQRRTAMVVGPLMLVEAGTATWLLAASNSDPLAWGGWILLLSIWLSTAFFQMPLHQRLAQGFDAQVARRLVFTNWWRTLAWTVRAVLASHMLALAISA